MLLQKTLRALVLVGLFVLPFIVFIISQSLFFPYITGKNFAFRVIVEIITGAWLALAFVVPEYRPRRSWLLGAFSLFVLIVAIADAQGAYPFKSFFSNYERMDGWVTLAHVFAYFVVLFSMLNTEKLWRMLLNVSLFGSLLMGCYGLLQIAGVTALATGFSSASRIDARFGNPIYLAVYMLFHVFIAAVLFAQTRAAQSQKRFLPMFFYGSILLLDTLVLFLTGTRGAMLGLIGGATLAVFAYAISSQSRRAWQMLGVVCVGVVLSAGALFAARDSSFVKSIGFLNRLSTISLSDSTTMARFLNWGIATKGFQERPLLGWGQENYAIVFDKYYDPRMYGQEQWFDRVHDIIFDWLIAAGVLGLLSYLSLFGVAFVGMWRSDAFSIPERSILSGLLVAYFFNNIFVFDNISSYMLFAMVLAYIAWRIGQHAGSGPITSVEFVSRRALPVVSVVSVLCVWGVATFVNAAPLAANYALIQAISPHTEGPSKNLEYFKQAFSYQSFGTQEAREQLVQLAASRVANDPSISSDIKQAYFETSVQQMEQMHQASPLDARFPLFLGALYEAYGLRQEAAEALQLAHQLSPAKQTILYEIASNDLASGDAVGALAAFKQAFELDEENTNARLYYASLLIRMGNEQEAEVILAPAIPSGNAADPRIVSAYLAVGSLAKAIPIWKARIQVSPSDSQAYFTLAAMYYQLKDKKSAIAILEQASLAVPSTATQVNTLIQEIKSGTVNL